MMAWYSPKPKRAILLLFFVLTNIKHMEQIKEDLISLIAEITETDFYYLEHIKEEINFIFSNSQQIKQDLISLIAKVTDAELPDLDNISEAIEQIFNQ